MASPSKVARFSRSRARPRRAAEGKASSVAPHKKSLLIVECQAEKLASQSLAMADVLAGMVAVLAPAVHVRVVKTSSEAELCAQLADCAEDGRFDTIVVIGHSNEDGLRIAGDRFAEWNVVTEWFRPFKPKYMVFAACRAGGWLPSKIMTDGIRTLNRVYGSPLLAGRDVLPLLAALVCHLVLKGPPPRELVRAGQITQFIATGRVVMEQQRSELADADVWTDLTWVGLERLIEQITPTVRSWIGTA